MPVPGRDPAPVVIALHGMGDRGSNFTGSLLARAQEEGWVLIAPTFEYGDWRDPNQVAREDARLVEELRTLVERLPGELKRPLQPRVLLYGFSRGAQLAHRFAFVHPQLVEGVAMFSAGTYTLPSTTFVSAGKSSALAWPFGCWDFTQRFGHGLDLDTLRTVKFLVAVGALDSNPSDIPRQWDGYLGKTRLERARAFADALESRGVPTNFFVQPGEGHTSSGLLRVVALDFLDEIDGQA